MSVWYLRRYNFKGQVMPAMVRVPGKAQNIAVKVLGPAINVPVKPNKRKKRIDQRTQFEETARVR
jgi:hypothetical protein